MPPPTETLTVWLRDLPVSLEESEETVSTLKARAAERLSLPEEALHQVGIVRIDHFGFNDKSLTCV